MTDNTTAIVPREPTPAMLRAAWDEGGLPTDDGIAAAEIVAAKVWRAMVSEALGEAS